MAPATRRWRLLFGILIAGALVVLFVPVSEAFEFQGYFRSGAGQNSAGGNQVCFQAPGASVKYRPGNECAGKRFYRRPEFHIDDFYFWDTSGPGAGVRDINVGLGKFAAANFRTANVKFDIFDSPKC